ncbi:MAG: aspartate carbamoyltransferase catalytic subunit [Actinobacteria bacterium]|nr:aspartate carbamoyltransferase catalytic subunit [Actinomycetota bacterium]
MNQSLISIEDLGGDEIARILATAERFEEVMRRDIKRVPTLRGRTVVSLFFEASTRTATSFELAAKRLSADVVSIKASASSVEKGETLKDTILTLNAYGPDIFVIRHRAVGACRAATRYTQAGVLNAGDGMHQHPTQALLDVYTLQREVGPVDRLHVAIVGDIMHSRVARSLVPALTRLGAAVTLVAPPTLMPRDADIAFPGTAISSDAADLDAADVIYVLRMQHERMGDGGFVPSIREYATRYGVNAARLRPGQFVMHPGPMNRGVELTDAVADGPAALIQQQAANGLVVRMAVIYDLLAEGTSGRAGAAPVEARSAA